jgi:methyl-accepting chemotaxis protein
MYGEQGQLAGVIALQLPTDRIVDIMNFDAGMGTTGETYLVGEDLLMRSDSRFSEDSTVLEVVVDTESVSKALLGEYGVEFIEDYRGKQVLSAYSSTQVGENTWAVIAEIDKAEILEIATSDRPMLAGLMLFFYSFAAWSVWFIQRSDVDAEGVSLLADLDLDGGMDLSDG